MAKSFVNCTNCDLRNCSKDCLESVVVAVVVLSGDEHNVTVAADRECYKTCVI